MARFGLEEIFVNCFVKNSVTGAFVIGAILASDVEDELFAKYSTVPPASAATGTVSPKSVKKEVKELNKKEYNKHFLLLSRNLKQAHNDQLVSNFVYIILSMLLCLFLPDISRIKI
jgi:hypothetical protein